MDAGVFIDLLVGLLLTRGRERKNPIRVPITHVDHANNGSWHFYSGNYQTRIRFENFKEAQEADSTIDELKNLPKGFSAKRDITDQKWERFEKATVH